MLFEFQLHSSDSDMGVCVCVCVLFQIFFPYKLLENIEYNSLCYTVGPYCLSILYIVVYLLLLSH